LLAAKRVPGVAELDAMFGPHGKPARQDAARAAARSAFLREGPRLLAAIKDGLAGGDAAVVSLNAHSLLGAGAYFGAAELSALCGRIEPLADAGQLASLAPLVQALEAELAAVMAAMAPAGTVPGAIGQAVAGPAATGPAAMAQAGMAPAGAADAGVPA
jgi:HPt (histidine-containing phosphotransfer) domain-containing protein